MSLPELKDLTKADIRSKLFKMGVSLDRTNHPKDYYVQLYLDKSNAKSKITRRNKPFYNENIINRKRERTTSYDDIKQREDKSSDANYEEEEYEGDEENQKSSIKNNYLKGRSNKKEEIISTVKKENKEEGNDYRDSGIKLTRLVKIKKKKIERPKRINSTEKKEEKSKKNKCKYHLGKMK